MSGWKRDDPDGQQTTILRHRMNDHGGADVREQHVNEMPSHSHGLSVLHKHHRSFVGEKNGAKTWKDSWDGTSYKTDNTGSNYGQSNQPPYYVLAWIMKL